MPKKKILCFEPSADSEFLNAGYEVVHSLKDKESILKAAVDCEGILTRTEIIDADIMMKCPQLKIVGRFGMGFDNIDISAATEMGIWVTNVPGGNIDAVAEGVLFLILALGRRFGTLERNLRKGNWDFRNECKGHTLCGKTLGLIGIGKIGRVVAEKAMHGLGMSVFAYDSYVQQKDAPCGVQMLENRDEIFSNCDFVSIHMPYFGKTLVGEYELSLMKPTAYLVNVARGLVLDEKALIRALQGNKIAGAGLDVFFPEPPEIDNPLLKMENVVVLPHSTGIAVEVFENNKKVSSQSIISAIEGKVPANAVNAPTFPRNQQVGHTG